MNGLAAVDKCVKYILDIPALVGKMHTVKVIFLYWDVEPLSVFVCVTVPAMDAPPDKGIVDCHEITQGRLCNRF